MSKYESKLERKRRLWSESGKMKLIDVELF